MLRELELVRKQHGGVQRGIDKDSGALLYSPESVANKFCDLYKFYFLHLGNDLKVAFKL